MAERSRTVIMDGYEPSTTDQPKTFQDKKIYEFTGDGTTNGIPVPAFVLGTTRLVVNGAEWQRYTTDAPHNWWYKEGTGNNEITPRYGFRSPAFVEYLPAE